jgi:hypothetical protein
LGTWVLEGRLRVLGSSWLVLGGEADKL